MPAFDDAFAASEYVRRTCGAQSLNRSDDVETPVKAVIETKALRHFNTCSLADATGGVMNTRDGQVAAVEQTEIAAFAKALMRFPVGPCDMMSALAFAYLVEKRGSFPVTRMSLQGADHVFLVVGTGVDLAGHWHQWDSATAAICDPWAAYAGVCTPMGMQTWMQTLGPLCPQPFQPGNRFAQGYGVNNRAAWNYALIG